MIKPVWKREPSMLQGHVIECMISEKADECGRVHLVHRCVYCTLLVHCIRTEKAAIEHTAGSHSFDDETIKLLCCRTWSALARLSLSKSGEPWWLSKVPWAPWQGTDFAFNLVEPFVMLSNIRTYVISFFIVLGLTRWRALPLWLKWFVSALLGLYPKINIARMLVQLWRNNKCALCAGKFLRGSQSCQQLCNHTPAIL